jgi:hypothetical protein
VLCVHRTRQVSNSRAPTWRGGSKEFQADSRTSRTEARFGGHNFRLTDNGSDSAVD